MLELAHLVVARLDRLIAALDEVVRFAVQVAALQRGLPFLLEVILSALDFVDDRFLVAAGDRGLQVLEPLVCLAEERSAVLRVATESPDFLAKLLDNFLALARAPPKYFAEAFVVDVLRAILVARNAVDRGRDQGVQRAGCFGMFGHGHAPLLVG